MEHKVIVAGIGPGSPDYLLPAAKAAIEKAKILVGSRRALQEYADSQQKTMEITGEIGLTIRFIKDHLSLGDVTVMVSGDPGYYSLLGALRREFPARLLLVIPGVSSMQLAFSRLALPWQDAVLVSLHGRTPDLAALRYSEGKTIGFLTDTVYDSHKITGLLIRQGWPATAKAYICSRLSYEDEQVIETTLGKIQAVEKFSHCIMVVIA